MPNDRQPSTPASSDRVYLTAAGVAERLMVTTRKVARWRRTGTGPRFFKASRAVRYLLADVERFEASRTFTSSAAALMNQPDRSEGARPDRAASAL